MVVLYYTVHKPQPFWKSSLIQLICMHSQMIMKFWIASTLLIANSELNSVMKLSGCLDNVGSWMDSNRLKMNVKKTEVIYTGSRNQLDKCESKEIHVRNDFIPRSPLIKYLGMWINELLTFQHHTNMKCKTAIWNLMKIQYLRQYFDQAIGEILIHSLVISHLDYVHIILFGATDKVINNLQ